MELIIHFYLFKSNEVSFFYKVLMIFFILVYRKYEYIRRSCDDEL